jgi:mitotic spindle assembly checkpoint protein MAD2
MCILIHNYFIQAYGINSILYQRGIYPPETFEPAEHFGITVYMTTNDGIKSFLKSVLDQIQG